MIDCNITVNYFAEKERLCASILECIDCPLRHGNDCTNIENKYPKRAISIVQRWSDQHPQKTYLTELLKSFPSTPLGDDGTPEIICPHHLGLKDIKDCEIDANCVECWNRIIEDGEE